MKAGTQPAKQPVSKVNRVLLWSGVATAVMTAVGFLLEHPWRVVPSAIAALATPVAFVTVCMVVWRMRHVKSRTRWVDDSYKQTLEAVIAGEDAALRFNQTLAAIAFILMGFMAAMFALVFNLLHTFNVK